jgi:hypothetical protein
MRVAAVRSQVGKVMQASISVFWDIVLLRRGPRDLPASASLLAAVAVLYLAAGVVAARLAFGPSLALVRGLLDIGLPVVVFWAVLAFRRCSHRLLQTLTALLGSGLILSIPDIVLLLALRGHAANEPIVSLLHLVGDALLVWNVIVIGYIVRAALEVPLLVAVAVATSYVALAILVDLQLQAPPLT